ncbi:MAG: SRPBCC domain-containing protein [Coleofasciculaceae cyanobacterium]
MLQNVKTEVFYPYPPERVWQVITNRRALAEWLMENDFEPRVGHKFRFQTEPQQGVNNTIYCEVIELDEPRCLSYTWTGNFMCPPTIVTWTLLPVEGGTKLQLEHTGFESKMSQFSQPRRLAQTRLNSYQPKAILEMQLLDIANHQKPLKSYQAVDNVDSATSKFYLNGGWEIALNSELKQILIKNKT